MNIEGGDRAEAKRLVQAERGNIRGLRADPDAVDTPDPGCGEADHAARQATPARGLGDPDQVDHQRPVGRAEELHEARATPVGLGDDHVIAARPGKEVGGPFRAAAVSFGPGDIGVEVQAREGEAFAGQRGDRVAVRRPGEAADLRGVSHGVRSRVPFQCHGCIDNVEPQPAERCDAGRIRGRQLGIQERRRRRLDDRSARRCIRSTLLDSDLPRIAAENVAQPVVTAKRGHPQMRIRLSLRAKRFLYHSI
jgi:hypothetical protein